jgi:AbrB family looped-hinge helix DNA binding protein
MTKAPLAESKITAQGQVSIPSAVRAALKVGPGERLIWERRGDVVSVRRAAGLDLAAVRARLGPPPRGAKSLREIERAVARARSRRSGGA